MVERSPGPSQRQSRWKVRSVVAGRAGRKQRGTVLLEPGDYVMTEWKGRFFAVGSVLIVAGGEVGGTRQARCCNDGHASPDEVHDCWEDSP